MRRLALVAVLGFIACPSAHADTVDRFTPSSTVPGCLNDWHNFDSQPAEQTCEGKRANTRWQERRATIVIAMNVVVMASRDPDHANTGAVGNALQALAVAADAAAETDQSSATFGPTEMDSNLTWLRVMFEGFKLPAPDRPGDGFRILAAILAKPGLLNNERATVYDRGAIIATGLATAVTETIPAAVRAAKAETAAAHAADFAAAPTQTPGNHHPFQQPGYGERVWFELGHFVRGLIEQIVVLAVILAVLFWKLLPKLGARDVLRICGTVLVVLTVSYQPLVLLHVVTDGSFTGVWFFGTWLAWLGVLMVGNRYYLPSSVRAAWSRVFGRSPASAEESTHGTAHFSTAEHAILANHLAPAAPADTFALGWMPGTPSTVTDARFRQGGHILTCAPTGAGKGIGAVIPNLLEYPGSAFVLDFKGENYAVTARARREAGQDVYLIDPFGITGAPRHSMNWLDSLDPNDPDVVSLSAALADMLVVSAPGESDPHWNDAAKELLRGLLIYVAGLEGPRRSMAEVRRIITSPEVEMADVFGDMMGDLQLGQRIVARVATAHVNRPERERASIVSTLVRHTGWLDDPRLEAAFSRSDFDLRDLKRRPMTIYIALPPDRLRVCLGFLRGFIGLALNAMTTVPGKPAARVAFFLDEFGQLGRMDSLADNITILRGYGAQFWLFVQDLSQLKAVYPRWQSFMANTTQQFFGTGDYDTAKYISDALGSFTIKYQTASQSSSSNRGGDGSSNSTGEHLQGRSLLTPDEVLRLGPDQPIVMIPGEAPYLLERINYLIDGPYLGRFEDNPMHSMQAAQ